MIQKVANAISENFRLKPRVCFHTRGFFSFDKKVHFC